MLGSCILFPGMLALLTPVVARWNVYGLLALRIAMGVVQVGKQYCEYVHTDCLKFLDFHYKI